MEWIALIAVAGIISHTVLRHAEIKHGKPSNAKKKQTGSEELL